MKGKTMTKQYKYDEIKAHFDDYINDLTDKEIKENIDDLHHDIFNTDYYIIGRYEAKQWLGDQVFNIIEIIREYEEFNFGSVNTDFSEPEKIVNMYVYIIGEEIVQEYREQLEAA
jgi:phosphate uptake regulator